jgi:osmotically-inducible protein OsmY
MTERQIPGADIKVQVKMGVVYLSSEIEITESQKELTMVIVKKIQGVKDINADDLRAA